MNEPITCMMCCLELSLWAAWYTTRLLVKLTPKGVVNFFLSYAESCNALKKSECMSGTAAGLPCEAERKRDGHTGPAHGFPGQNVPKAAAWRDEEKKKAAGRVPVCPCPSRSEPQLKEEERKETKSRENKRKKEKRQQEKIKQSKGKKRLH